MALYNANLKNNGYTKLYLDIAWGAPSIAGNYTPVTYSLYMKGEGGEWDREGSWGDITIDGVKSDFTLPSYDFRDKGVVTYTLVASNTVNIPHDIYGNKTLAYKAYYNPNNPGYMIAGTIQGSVSLPNIPRASKFTASDVTAGAANIPISLSKSPAATTHKAKVLYKTTVICDKDIGASPTNIPLTAAEWLIFYNLTKTVESGTLSVILTSYNNSSVLGSDEKTVTANYADADMPTLTSVTIVDNNATVNSVIGATNYLQLLSQIKITANGATGVKSSTITGYELQVKQGTTVVGTYGANSPVYIPQSSGAFTALARVKDSRGRWSDWKSIAFTVLAYERPKITNYKNKRVTSAGADSIDGTYVKHEFSLAVTSVLIGGVQKNNIRYRIDRTSPTPIATIVSTKTVLNTAATGSEIIGTYPATSSFDFLLVLTDAFGQTISALDVISAANFPFFLGIKGAAVGGIFNEAISEIFQAYGKSVFYDDIRVYGGRTFVDGYDNTTYPLGIYHYSSGVLIDTGLVSTTTSHMCLLRIYGNSYGNLDPIDTLLQFYWYWNSTNSTYSFPNCAQRNLGYELGQIKLMVINGKVHIWIPPLASASYVTLKLELYTWNGQTVPCTATNSAEPSTGASYKTSATIKTDKYVPPANTPTDFNAWFDGRFPSIFNANLASRLPTQMNSSYPGTLGTTGYQRLPNGLILQYGTFTYPASTYNTTLTYPIAFPNACRAIIGSAQPTKSGFDINSATTANWAAWPVVFHTVGAANTKVLVRAGDDNTPSSSAMVVHWMAIGY